MEIKEVNRKPVLTVKMTHTILVDIDDDTRQSVEENVFSKDAFIRILKESIPYEIEIDETIGQGISVVSITTVPGDDFEVETIVQLTGYNKSAATHFMQPLFNSIENIYVNGDKYYRLAKGVDGMMRDAFLQHYCDIELAILDYFQDYINIERNSKGLTRVGIKSIEHKVESVEQ